MSVRYRTAGPADAPALADMGRRCFVETFGPHFPPDDMALHLERKFGSAALDGEFLDPALAICVAEQDGAAIAYLKLGPMDLPVPHAPDALQVMQVYVLAPWQGAGVAGSLMDWAAETARARGAPALYLCVWEKGDRAIAFYRKRGFETVGETPYQLGTLRYRDPVMRLAL
ncbi:MAG TPA: GNAT family N-acetyltransferase [Allosphingosinicella sp.]|nr:GNAT family N-acetyltransferase [Allosphingosinicella sp.]